ncbi:MAG: hypothetical protein WED09_07225 [Homoserinimonas sp.]
MAELLVGEDVEVAFITELDGAMPAIMETGVAAGTKIPGGDDKPTEFIRVVLSGGAERDLVTDSPTVTVEYFAVKEGRAARGAAFALAVLQRAGRVGSLGGVPCYGVTSFSLPANLPHPEVPDRFRYQFTVSADLRKSVV